MGVLPAVNLSDPDAVIECLSNATAAMRGAACRSGSVELIEPPGRLIATGDLHDNPDHFARLLELFEAGRPGDTGPTHLTLHEIIHSDRLVNKMDFSYRALTRVAALKGAFPERVHVLLGNHELAQATGAGIVKDGVRSVEAFNAGVDYAFGDRADEVKAAIEKFILAMPLALRVHTRRGDILCMHSVPAAASMGRFDTTILSREMTSDDYQARVGSAHIATWGRGYDAEGLEDLVERWHAYLFILGHEKAEEGAKFVPPCAVILNSDHERGVYMDLDMDAPPRPEEAMGLVRPLTRGA